MWWMLRAPADQERGPEFCSQVFAALQEANPRRRPLRLLIADERRSAGLFVELPEELRFAFESQFAAQYPACRWEPFRPDPSRENCRTLTKSLRWTPELFEARTADHRDSGRSADPLAALIAAIAPRERDGCRCRLLFEIRPPTAARLRRARRTARSFTLLAKSSAPRGEKYLRALQSRFWPLRMLARFSEFRWSASRDFTPAERVQKINERLWDCSLSIQIEAPATAVAVARQRLDEILGAISLANTNEGTWQVCRHATASLLTSAELALLWHPPTVMVRNASLRTAEHRLLEASPDVPCRRTEPSVAVLGTAKILGRKELIGLRPDDRLRHLLVIGKTGVGKSTLVERLLLHEVEYGGGCGLVDPHGDLIESLRALIPRRRTNDVVLLDAGANQPLTFNPLAAAAPHERPLVASGIISAFKKCYPDSWGPRLEHILRNCVLTLLETPHATLLSILPLLSDITFRRLCLQSLTDPVVKAFWSHEFDRWPERLRAEALAPVQNKVGAFASNPLLRKILGEPRGRLDLRRTMDEGKILLINLSKGRVGEDASQLLGSFLITSLQLAAMRRADVAEEARRPFHLAVDEFQNYATESFATILSEARKYRLGLVLSHQYLSQLPPSLQDAVLGNVGSLIAFQVGEDATRLASLLGPDVVPLDLQRLPRYHAYARLLIDGQPSRPFSLRTLPRPRPPKSSARSLQRRTQP